MQWSTPPPPAFEKAGKLPVLFTSSGPPDVLLCLFETYRPAHS